jgi:hypothetical protein
VTVPLMSESALPAGFGAQRAEKMYGSGKTGATALPVLRKCAGIGDAEWIELVDAGSGIFLPFFSTR